MHFQLSQFSGCYVEKNADLKRKEIVFGIFFFNPSNKNTLLPNISNLFLCLHKALLFVLTLTILWFCNIVSKHPLKVTPYEWDLQISLQSCTLMASGELNWNQKVGLGYAYFWNKILSYLLLPWELVLKSGIKELHVTFLGSRLGISAKSVWSS